MPRRPRPPLTVRELGAFMAGQRAAKATGCTYLTATELETMAMDYAEQDMPIAMSLDLDKYIHFFLMGYETKLRLDAVQ